MRMVLQALGLTVVGVIAICAIVTAFGQAVNSSLAWPRRATAGMALAVFVVLSELLLAFAIARLIDRFDRRRAARKSGARGQDC